MSISQYAQKTPIKKYNAIFDKSIVLYAKILYNKSNAVVLPLLSPKIKEYYYEVRIF